MTVQSGMTDYSNPELSFDALFEGVKVSPWEVEKNLALPLFALEDPKRYQEFLVALVEGWRDVGTKALNSKSQRLYACDCAERVLSLFELKFPEDKRPRKAIEVARLYTEGQATLEESRQAEKEAREASREAGAAMWSASEAAWSAAEAAAESAWAAAEAARSAWSSWAASGVAREAREQEKQWQADRVRHYYQREQKPTQLQPLTFVT